MTGVTRKHPSEEAKSQQSPISGLGSLGPHLVVPERDTLVKN